MLSLNSKGLQILQRRIDPWTYQTPHLDEHQSFLRIKDSIDAGRLWMIEDHGVVMMFERETKFLAQIHLFADDGLSVGHWSRYGLPILKHFFDKTEVKKVYGKFSDRRIMSLAMRGGFKKEGVLSKAHMIQSGDMIDLHIAGITKDELYARIEKG